MGKKELKFNYNDDVHFMYKNKPVTGFVYEIKIKQRTIWDMQLHNFKHKESEVVTEVSYKICLDSYNKVGTGWIPEKKLFGSKTELLDSLEKV